MYRTIYKEKNSAACITALSQTSRIFCRNAPLFCSFFSYGLTGTCVIPPQQFNCVRNMCFNCTFSKCKTPSRFEHNRHFWNSFECVEIPCRKQIFTCVTLQINDGCKSFSKVSFSSLILIEKIDVNEFPSFACTVRWLFWVRSFLWNIAGTVYLLYHDLKLSGECSEEFLLLMLSAVKLSRENTWEGHLKKCYTGRENGERKRGKRYFLRHNTRCGKCSSDALSFPLHSPSRTAGCILFRRPLIRLFSLFLSSRLPLFLQLFNSFFLMLHYGFSTRACCINFTAEKERKTGKRTRRAADIVVFPFSLYIRKVVLF